MLVKMHADGFSMRILYLEGTAVTPNAQTRISNFSFGDVKHDGRLPTLLMPDHLTFTASVSIVISGTDVCTSFSK